MTFRLHFVCFGAFECLLCFNGLMYHKCFKFQQGLMFYSLKHWLTEKDWEDGGCREKFDQKRKSLEEKKMSINI